MPDVLRPLFDQVVIKELEPDRMRKSGLLVPEGTQDVPPNEGIVLAVGDGPPDLPDFKMPVAPGDHVLFPRSAGVWVEVEDERLLPRARDPRRDRVGAPARGPLCHVPPRAGAARSTTRRARPWEAHSV